MLTVRNLSKTFFHGLFRRQSNRVFSNLSFAIPGGETLGLVGGSGCGKSTVARCILKLIPADAGEVYLDADAVFTAEGAVLQALRRRMQIIFQHPYSALDPRMTLLRSMTEPMAIHHLYDEEERNSRVGELCRRVELHHELLNRYPHQVSGGQLQRAVIVRALALSPEFIIFDEPTSMLDISVQAAILRLLKELQNEFRLTYLFISHDIDVVKFMSNRIVRMDAGKIGTGRKQRTL